MFNETYVKSYSQEKIEQLIDTLNKNHYTFEYLLSSTKEEDKDFLASFRQALYLCIDDIFNEVSVQTSISNLAGKSTSRYDVENKQYDLFYELQNNTYLGLFSKLGKGNHEGILRLDAPYYAQPDLFYKSLRFYIKNNILTDYARKIKEHNQRHVSEFTETTDGETVSIFDFTIDTRMGSNPTETVAIDNLRETPEGSEFILATINRFRRTKPVALYVFFKILFNEYNAPTIVDELVSEDFSSLMLHYYDRIEDEFHVDLSDVKVFNENPRFLINLKEVDYETAVDRIYNLKSSTMLEVESFDCYKNLLTKHRVRM